MMSRSPSSRRYAVLVIAAIALGAGFALVEMASPARRPADRRFNAGEGSTTSDDGHAYDETAESVSPTVEVPLARPMPNGGSAFLDAAAGEKLRATT
jgi:hypothetical protein